MKLASAPGSLVSPRQKVVTTILKTIPRFAQTNQVTHFLGFIKILDEPSLLAELVDPLDGSEIAQAVRAMNRAHQAFGVPYRAGPGLPWYFEYLVKEERVGEVVDSFAMEMTDQVLELALRLEPQNAFIREVRWNPITRFKEHDRLARELPQLLERSGLHTPGSTLYAYRELLREIVASPEFESFRKRYQRFLKFEIENHGGMSLARRGALMKLSAKGLEKLYRGFAAHRLDESQRAATKDWFFWR